MKYSINNSKGFTLVETLVAILALSLSLGALILISARSVQQTRDAESRLQAEMLAVEGIEIARQLVSNQIIASIEGGFTGNPFETIDGCKTGCDVYFDDAQNSANLSKCNNVATCARVDNVTSSNGYANFVNPATNSKFYRMLYVKESGVNHGNICDGRLVRSVVWYSDPTQPNPKFISLTDEIRSWYVPLGEC